jgi:hypothetical protein
VDPNVREKLSESQASLDECNPCLLFREESSSLSGIAFQSLDGCLGFRQSDGEAWENRIQYECVVRSVWLPAIEHCFVDFLSFSKKELAISYPVGHLLTLGKIRERASKTFDGCFDSRCSDRSLQRGYLTSSSLESCSGCPARIGSVRRKKRACCLIELLLTIDGVITKTCGSPI